MTNKITACEDEISEINKKLKEDPESVELQQELKGAQALLKHAKKEYEKTQKAEYIAYMSKQRAGSNTLAQNNQHSHTSELEPIAMKQHYGDVIVEDFSYDAEQSNVKRQLNAQKIDTQANDNFTSEPADKQSETIATNDEKQRILKNAIKKATPQIGR